MSVAEYVAFAVVVRDAESVRLNEPLTERVTDVSVCVDECELDGDVKVSLVRVLLWVVVVVTDVDRFAVVVRDAESVRLNEPLIDESDKVGVAVTTAAAVYGTSLI